MSYTLDAYENHRTKLKNLLDETTFEEIEQGIKNSTGITQQTWREAKELKLYFDSFCFTCGEKESKVS